MAVRHTYWKNTLLDLFTEKRTEFNIIYEDEWVWVIDDKYPKSKDARSLQAVG